MSDRLTAKLRMYKSLLSFLKRNASTWGSLPAFAKAVQSLEEEIKSIETLNPGLQADLSGATLEKGALKTRMIEETVSLSGVLQAYAHDINSLELETSAAVSKTDFAATKELDADDLALHVYQLGLDHIAHLGDYGRTQADLDLLAGYIENFSERIGQPKDLLKSTQSKRAQQQAHFDAADTLVQKKLDNLIEQFKTKDKVFYDDYQSARTVSRTGGRSSDQENDTNEE